MSVLPPKPSKLETGGSNRIKSHICIGCYWNWEKHFKIAAAVRKRDYLSTANAPTYSQPPD